MELKGKKINFIGDSITQGVGCADKANIYVNRLERDCEFAVARNYGVSGTRIAEQNLGYFGDYHASNFGGSFCARYLKMDDDADIVGVFGGTNDYGHGNVPIGELGDTTPFTFYGACYTLFGGLITKYPNALIFAMTPIHRVGDKVPGQYNGKPLSAYVNAIKKVAEYFAIPVLDLYSMSGIQPDFPIVRERLCPDGLHPNDAGHKLIADRVTGFLRSI